MANSTLNMQLLLRRDQVFTSTYVLEAGEPGFEISTNTLKIGDGAKTWADLPIANKSEIDKLIKVVDDKVSALNDTFATDEELENGLALKADLETYNAYVKAHENDYTNTQIDDAVAGAKTHAETKISEFKTTSFDPVAADVATIKSDYLKAADIANFETKENVKAVADDLDAYKTANDSRVKAVEDEIATYGDIVTHNAAEFEAAGAAAEAEGRINETLKSYYTKTEADAAFTTPAEVISEVNKALAEVSNADTIENISTLVNYVNENAADLIGLITEVYGNAEMTGDSRLDTIEAKAAMDITADDITAWNAEKGVKAIVDANKETWDKAATALQAADLADYAKTADVVTNDEFTAFESANTEAIGKKLDKSVFDEFNNGTSKSVSAIEADIVAKANAAQAAAEATAAADATAKANKALEDAKAYADGKEHKNTTYTAAATANALEFTLTPSEGEAQTVTLVAPTVDTGVMAVTAGTDVVVTPSENGSVEVAHATYQTGTIKAAEGTEEPNFVTSVTIANGHVTGATVQTLKAALESMTFVLDGGNSTNV